MRIIDALLGELEQEAKTTARVLERVPEAHLTWKPHPKSFSLGQLALHVATVPGSVAALAARDTTESPGFAQPEAASTGELLPALHASVARARELLGGFDDAAMTATWRLVAGEREIMAMPRVAFVRAIMLNHWYHHRGQLLVYLRLLDVPVPSVYGPTADESERVRRRVIESRRGRARRADAARDADRPASRRLLSGPARRADRGRVHQRSAARVPVSRRLRPPRR